MSLKSVDHNKLGKTGNKKKQNTGHRNIYSRKWSNLESESKLNISEERQQERFETQYRTVSK